MEKKPDNNPEIKSGEEELYEELLVFTIHTLRCAIEVKYVDHVIRMVAITPVPKSPYWIVGIINYHGEIIPVFSMRRYYSLPDKQIKPTDYLVIINNLRTIAIIAEGIERVIQHLSGVIRPDKIYQGIEGLSGIYRCNDGLLLISNPEALYQVCNEEIMIDNSIFKTK